MAEVDFAKLDIFCANEQCGDPVPYANGARTRRRMNYIGEMGSLFSTRHTYKCPVCGRTRSFNEYGSECTPSWVR